MNMARAWLVGGSLLGLSSFLACVGDPPEDGPGASSSGTNTSSSSSGTNASSSGASTSSSSGNGSTSSSSSSSSGSLDSGPDAPSGPRCDKTADFGNVHELAGLGTALVAVRPAAQQWLDATLSDDERFMLFSACDTLANNAVASCDIYQAALDAAGTVTSVQRLDTLSDPAQYDRHPTLATNLLRVFLTRQGTIHTASRSDTLGTFGAASPVASLDYDAGVFGDSDPFLSRGGTLFFMRGPGGASRAVYYAQVNATSITGAQQLSPQLSGALLDPVMADVDGNAESLLFIAKNDAGRRVIYTSERTGATWSALTNKYVAELNAATTSNFVNWATPDSCRLYFSRGTSLSGGFKIYVAERPPL